MAIPQEPAARSQQHLFGPVRSRRLGLSLGVDIIPRKACSLDCVYCEVGLTTRYEVDPAPYFDAGAITREIESALAARPDIDWVTFSGSGEPTLNSLLGPMIREVKRRTCAPVAVITNGTLLWKPDVRRALALADVVLPSLDAVSPEAFRKINRPHPILDPVTIVEGLAAFRREYTGQIWLEILLVEGINDSDGEVGLLRDAVAAIRPDKIHLNTVVRPPAEPWARPVSARRMREIAALFGERAEIISPLPSSEEVADLRTDAESLVRLLARRPMRLEELRDSMQAGTDVLAPLLARLIKEGTIERRRFEREEFYALRPSAV